MPPRLTRPPNAQRVRSEQVRALMDSASTRMSVKDVTAVAEERHAGAVAFLFAFAVAQLFSSSLHGDNLSDTVGVAIEQVRCLCQSPP